MNEKSVQYNAESLQTLIFTVRGQRVIFDADLAHIYGVPTKRLNEQVRRNADRFPPDFLIQLTPSEAKEIQGLRSQFATLKRGRHGALRCQIGTLKGQGGARGALRGAVESLLINEGGFVRTRHSVFPAVSVETISERIVTVRGKKVIAAADLAEMYGVATRTLNQAVKRNAARFPSDFVFQLTLEEADTLTRSRSQIVILKRGRNIKYLPYVFTEHGAIMAASVLNSMQAVEMSVFVVRAFVRMRSLLGDTRELARRLAALEKELKERLDVHEVAIVSILQRVMDLIDPPAAPELQPRPRKKIGFEVKEPRRAYGRSRGKK